MNHTLIHELQPGDSVLSFFIVRKKELKEQRKNRELYITFDLGDSSGRIRGSVWDCIDEINKTISVHDIVKVKGKVIGVAEVINKIGGELFTADDILLFNALADQAAIAIENAKLYKDLRSLFVSTVTSLATAIEAKDPHTRGHSERVAHICLSIANKMKLSFEEKERLHIAALLHDIGKIGIPEEILKKPAKLSNDEWIIVKEHPDKGADILKPIKQLQDILPIIRHHHERYGGAGYPDGLKDGDIPLGSRIIAIADNFDAMASTRPYRRPMKRNVAVEEIIRCKGTQFDPQIVDSFLECYEYK